MKIKKKKHLKIIEQPEEEQAGEGKDDDER
jgi:hypothetical protein